MATQAAAWREQGNACMAAGDHVEAMKCYSQALTTTPKDASLFSNRSFAFLRLGLSARALSDAENAIRHRPEWPKAWFRKAEALAHARLHELAMAAYRTCLSLDPLDTHLQAKASHTHSLFSFFLFHLQAKPHTPNLPPTAHDSHVSAADLAQSDEQAQVSKAEAAGQRERRIEQMRLALAVAIGFSLALLLVMAPTQEAPRATGSQRRDSAALSATTQSLALALGLALGALGGYAANMLVLHARRGAVLPPLESNEAFAARQIRGGGAELLGRTAAQPGEIAREATAAGVVQPAGARTERRRPNAKAGRTAALRAMGKAQ